MKKFLKILTHASLTLLFVGYIAYQFRTDPIGILSGRAVTGEEVAYPADWSFSNDHDLIAVETRPGDPHSVTTVCFLVDGVLHIPARNGAEKDWTKIVMSDNRARLKIGEKVYPVSLTRVMDLDMGKIAESVGAKYPQFAGGGPDADGTWLFRVGPRA